MTIPPEALVDHFQHSVGAAQDLMAEDHELHSQIDNGEEVVSFPIDVVAGIEPGQSPGTFIMRFKQELSENKGTVILVSGAALIACAGLIAQRRKNSPTS